MMKTGTTGLENQHSQHYVNTSTAMDAKEFFDLMIFTTSSSVGWAHDPLVCSLFSLFTSVRCQTLVRNKCSRKTHIHIYIQYQRMDVADEVYRESDIYLLHKLVCYVTETGTKLLCCTGRRETVQLVSGVLF